jgi:hypothetical protein
MAFEIVVMAYFAICDIHDSRQLLLARVWVFTGEVERTMRVAVYYNDL